MAKVTKLLFQRDFTFPLGATSHPTRTIPAGWAGDPGELPEGQLDRALAEGAAIEWTAEQQQIWNGRQRPGGSVLVPGATVFAGDVDAKGNLRGNPPAGEGLGAPGSGATPDKPQGDAEPNLDESNPSVPRTKPVPDHAIAGPLMGQRHVMSKSESDRQAKEAADHAAADTTTGKGKTPKAK